MSMRGFRSVFMVASCAGAALGCYLVSLRVASERAALEAVETRIVLAQRDIRLLQTEIGTRGRLAQLERWNVKVLALSAPSADQFLDGGFALARMVAPRGKVDLDAPVVLASAPANAPRPQVEGRQQQNGERDEAGMSPKQMLHTASLPREPKPNADSPAAPKAADKPAPAIATAVKPKPDKKAVVPRPEPAQTPALAKVDPLAPRPTRTASNANAKDNGSKQ